MSRRVRAVTDSTAQFTDPNFRRIHEVTVVPLTIHLGGQAFRDGVDIDSEELLARSAASRELPVAAAPRVEEFAQTYQDLGQGTVDILSIHVSGKLSATLQHARAASQRFLGRATVVPVDSLTTSVGLGLLVQQAVQAAEAGEPVDEIVRIVRGLIPRMYAIYFTESLDFLQNAGRIPRSQAVLGGILGMKPFLISEEGDLLPMEKVRTRAQAAEKLWEFICEFSEMQFLGILQENGRVGEEARLLLERLALEFPAAKPNLLTYNPFLATILGPKGLGVVILESSGKLE